MISAAMTEPLHAGMYTSFARYSRNLGHLSSDAYLYDRREMITNLPRIYNISLGVDSARSF